MLFPVFEGPKKGTPPDLIYCGHNEGAKKTAAALIHDEGFNPMGAGPLSTARYVEPFSPLVAKLAYEGSGGAELAYRFEQLGKPQ